MRNRDRRLEALNEELGMSDDALERLEAVHFAEQLSDTQLDWLLEPTEEAQRRVPCPHTESLECDCRSSERTTRGFEAFPELVEEYERRQAVLKEELTTTRKEA